MNAVKLALAVLVIAVAGFVGFKFSGNGRYQIVSIRAPYDYGAPPPYDPNEKLDPNDPLLHETIMLDTATGRTWQLHMILVDKENKIYNPWWVFLGYRAYPDPDPKMGVRTPN